MWGKILRPTFYFEVIMKNLYKGSRSYAEIKTSTLKIPEQLNTIDPKYFVLYNHKKRVFEIHYEGNQGSTYCFDTDTLDSSVISEVRRTASHRGLEIFDEIDRHNESIEKKAKEYMKEKFDDGERELKSILRSLK